MRVITGSARGRRLLAPAGLDTRPTSERVKEAVFSVVQFELEGAEVLDLFAGSGQMGIEALSRGARSAVFVESAKEAQEVIRKNLEATGFAASAQLVAGDAESYLRREDRRFDIAFLDPPYAAGLLERVLLLVAARMRPGGVIFCESLQNQALPETANGWVSVRKYRYGRTKITAYRRPEEALS